MPNEFKMKHSSAVLMAALAAAFPLSGQAANAARVDFAVGDVKALAADGRSRTLAKGAEIESGEMIDTGSGRAQVRFTDGAQVSLAPQTQFRIDDYKFAGKADGNEKGFFSLLKGAMRTITGLVGRSNRENYRVTTTVATIGIRGTEFSVTYGNSINVTTGEGSNEVCNAAGCLILNSGETAYVADNTTRPVMTDNKTEIPPPPAQGEQLPGFVAGDNTNSEGVPTGLTPPSGPSGLVSGPGYSLAAVGVFDDGSPYASIGVFDGNTDATYATFSGGGLANYSAFGGTETITQGAPVGMLTDGIIGWGRWIDGTFFDGYEGGTMQHVHYVVGMPTSPVEMASLSGTANFTLRGFTFPTAWDGSTFTFGTQSITGSLTANFTASTIMGTLGVPLGANTYSSSWSGGIAGANFVGMGSVSSTGFDCSCSCGSSVMGFFAGANAARAGLVYELYGTTYGDIHGAAVFQK